jgi:hypothetical protein
MCLRCVYLINNVFLENPCCAFTSCVPFSKNRYLPVFSKNHLPDPACIETSVVYMIRFTLCALQISRKKKQVKAGIYRCFNY